MVSDEEDLELDDLAALQRELDALKQALGSSYRRVGARCQALAVCALLARDAGGRVLGAQLVLRGRTHWQCRSCSLPAARMWPAALHVAWCALPAAAHLTTPFCNACSWGQRPRMMVRAMATCWVPWAMTRRSGRRRAAPQVRARAR